MIDDMYLDKVVNILQLSFSELIENTLYLYEDKSKFEDIKEMQKNIFEIFQSFADLTKEAPPENIKLKIDQLFTTRKKYLDYCSALLGNLEYSDYLKCKMQLEEKLLHKINGDDLIDKDSLMNYIKLIKNEAKIPNPINTIYGVIMPCVDNNKFIEYFEKMLYVSCDNMNLYALNSLLYSLISKSTYKFVKGADPYNIYKMLDEESAEEIENFSQISLKHFDICQIIFDCYSYLICIYTYINEFNAILDENIELKDLFYATKKIILENDKFFIENIYASNEVLLDAFYKEKDDTSKAFNSINIKETDKKIEHKYTDFIIDLIEETPHYIGGAMCNKSDIDTIISVDIVKEKCADFFCAFQNITKNLDEVGKIIAYANLITNLEYGVKFYNIDKYVKCPYDEMEAIKILNDTIVKIDDNLLNLIQMFLDI